MLQLEGLGTQQKVFKVHRSLDVKIIQDATARWLKEVVPKARKYVNFLLIKNGKLLQQQNSLKEVDI